MFFVQKVRINLTNDQQLLLDSQSRISNWLYNHYLAVSVRYYRIYNKRLTYNRINKNLSRYKDKKPFLKTVNNTVLKNTLRTLDKTFTKFFKEKKVGFPKFKSWKIKFRSLEYDANKGFKIINNNHIQINFGSIFNQDTGKNSIPNIVVKLTEPLEEGKPGQMTITKTKKKYYLCLRYEINEPELLDNDVVKALDLNQSNLFGMITTNGESVIMDKPAIAKYFDKQIAKVKSKRDLCKKGSRRYKYLNKVISRLYFKRREQIKMCLYTIANNLIKECGKIVVGDYSPFRTGIKNINHGVLAQGLVGQFRSILEWVCRKSGIAFEVVNEYRTSKECSQCGNVKKDLTLKDRLYECSECGLKIHRDINSAINILKKVLPRTGESYVVGSTVNWKWMSNHLSMESLQINRNVLFGTT